MREDWDTAISGEILDVRDGTHDTPKYIEEAVHPLVTSKNLKNGVIDLSNVKYISNDSFQEINKRSKVDIGDVLFAMIGTIGNPVVITLEPNYSIKNVGLFKNVHNVINSKLLGYYLDSLNFYSQLEKRQFLKGTTQKFIPLGHLRKLEIPIAPIPEQRAIVAKIEELFSDLDKGIADLKKAQDQLVIFRQAVLMKAFEGLEEETTLEDIKEESLIGLVRSSGLQNSAGEGVAYIKMDKIDMIGNVNLEGLVYVEANKDEIEKYSLKSGDILLNTRNSYELVGKTGVIRNIKETIVFNNNIMRIRVKDNFNPYFICYQLISPFVRKQMEQYKKATTSVCALYQRNLFPLKLKNVTLENQNQIVKEIESRLSVCDKVEESITESLDKSKALRQSILKKAFEGTLLSEEEIAACKAAPDYEPASVLLEKIKAEKKK